MFKSWPTIRQETKQESKIKPRTKFSRRLPSTATRRTALRPARPVLHKHFAHSQQKKRKRRKRRRESKALTIPFYEAISKPNLRSRKLLHVSTAGFLLTWTYSTPRRLPRRSVPVPTSTRTATCAIFHIARQYILFLRQT
jgi:hypothetical protein